MRRSASTRALAAVAALAAAGLGGCARDGEPRLLSRSGPFGSLRDLVLIERPQAQGGPFFLDRFEATRGDFAAFAATAEGRRASVQPLPVAGDQDALPMLGLDLATARAFAAWRRCRLPRADEWVYACTNEGRDRFPWGSYVAPVRANTSDLGVFDPLPVGTFESGRTRAGVYDLVGNASEWTESVPHGWFIGSRDPEPVAWYAQRSALAAPGLAVWQPAPLLVAPVVVVAAAGSSAPREVVGADYRSSMLDEPQLRAPTDFADPLGCRFASSPEELVESIGDDVLRLSGDDLELWRRFCRRAGHAAVLLASLATADVSPACRQRWSEEVQ